MWSMSSVYVGAKCQRALINTLQGMGCQTNEARPNEAKIDVTLYWTVSAPALQPYRDRAQYVGHRGDPSIVVQNFRSLNRKAAKKNS